MTQPPTRKRFLTLENAGKSLGMILAGFSQAAMAQGQSDEVDGGENETRAKEAMVFSLPVLRGEGPIGEIEASVDASGKARFESASLTRVLRPLLSEVGEAKLLEATAGSPFVVPSNLLDFGFDIRFYMSRLEVVVENIDPNLQRVVNLTNGGADATLNLAPTVQPADFSAYLNLSGTFDYVDAFDERGARDPEILAFGAIRSGPFALHYEGGLTELPGGKYGPYRRYVRGTYDLEDSHMRISAGDLQANNLPIMGTQLIGGVGVERSRRIFEPFDPVFQLGGRRLRISSPSSIEIVSNGELLRTIPVEQGIYDLDELPLVAGANDVDIIIRDSAGRTSVTKFNYFYDPVDLEVGDYEFGAFAGVVSDAATLEPDYSGELAATGYYRRAITPSLLLGAGVQISEDLQTVGAEVRWVPQSIPGVIESQFSLSSGSNGVGYATRIGYRWSRSTEVGGQQVSILFDYEDPNFELLGRPSFFNEERFSVTASYSQSLSFKTLVTAGLNYFERQNAPARRTVFADMLHQFSPRLRGTIGAEYGENDALGSSFGARVGLTVLFGANSRSDTTYESRRDLFRASVNRGIENNAGSLGYDATIQNSSGSSRADASLRYRGNRMDGRLLVSGSGDGFGNITDERRAQLQVATSLAYADGAFGVGRSITDGFALVTPHPRIEGKAIVGNDLNGGEYQGRSGLLGAAVVPNVIGYQNREVIYDIDKTGTAYDIGDGTDRIRVRTGGGAKIVVGNARFVSAIGTLVAGDAHVSLKSGRVTSASDEGFEPQPFFTNTVGRFAVIGLAPGEKYTVQLRDGREFTLDIPSDNDGLFRTDIIAIKEEES